MVPQRWKVPISIVAVNHIDHTDWLNIMVDDLNHLSPHVLIFFFRFPNVWKWMHGYRYTSHFIYIPQSPNLDQYYHESWISLLASSIPIRQHPWFTVNFTMLKEQELFFIWHLYEEANIFKLYIFCVCKNNHLSISAHWLVKFKNKRIGLRKENQHEEISGSNPPP